MNTASNTTQENTEELERKKQQLFSRIAERHQKEREKKKDVSEEKQMADASIQQFWNHMNELSTGVEFHLDTVPQNVEIKEKMQQLLNANLHLLSQYDIRQANDKIISFDNQINESRKEKQKGKFSFSSRRAASNKKPLERSSNTNTTTTTGAQTNSTTSHSPPIPSTDMPIPPKAKTFDSIQGELTISSPSYSNNNEQEEEEEESKQNNDLLTTIMPDDDIVVSNCNDAKVIFCCVIGAAYLKNLKNCTILLGPTKSSVFIQNCTNCTFAIASKQIRIHTSENCNFYIYARSNPIIEHCKNVRFGQYNLDYPNMKHHFQMANFDIGQNTMWKEVKDFNWLGATKSPNWTLMDQSETLRV